ncbi:MAG: hypothetical protein ABIH42_00960, partial [Planctomycetota bacterium]
MTKSCLFLITSLLFFIPKLYAENVTPADKTPSSEKISTNLSVSDESKEQEERERELIVDMSVLFKYEADEDSYSTKALFGLFNWEGRGDNYSKFIVRPVLYKECDTTKEYSDTTLFYGLFSTIKEKDCLTSWLFPVYYYKKTPESKTVLVPFFYRSKGADYSTWIFYPFFGHHKENKWESFYFACPFGKYSKSTDSKVVLNAPFPFLRYSEGPKGTWFHLFPFVWYNIDTQQYGALVLFPVFWGFENKETHLSLLLPVYWDYQSKDESFFMIFPFYGTSKSEDYSNIILGFPLFSHTSRRLPDNRELGFCDKE